MRGDNDENEQIIVAIIALVILVVWLLSSSGYLSAYLHWLLGHA